MQHTLFQQSYQSKIQALLKAGRTLTVVSVLKEVGTIDGRKFFSNLRKSGMPIVDKWNVTGDGKKYKSYWLYKEAN